MSVFERLMVNLSPSYQESVSQSLGFTSLCQRLGFGWPSVRWWWDWSLSHFLVETLR